MPVHKDHRYWHDLNYIHISAAKNTTILHASGELLITFDDAELFPNHLLQLAWDKYKHGELLTCLHQVENLGGSVTKSDHRWKRINKPTIVAGNWCYAGTSFPRSAAFDLNGFNESMDGQKNLEDCEFGIRLTKAGLKPVMDPRGYLTIMRHQTSYSHLTSLVAVDNYGILKVSEQRRETKANCRKYSEAELKVIRDNTIKYRGFDPVSNEANFALWLNTPSFDLTKQREEL